MKEYGLATAKLIDFMLSQADAWFITVSSDLKVTAWNATAQRISGYGKKDFKTLAGLAGLLLPNAVERAQMVANFTGLGSAGERIHQFRTRIITRSGNQRLIEWTIDFLPEPGSEKQRIAVAVGIDRTDSPDSITALYHEETIHRLLLENLQEGIWWIDPEGRSLYMNSQLKKTLGIHSSTLIGKRISDFLPIGLDALVAPVSVDTTLTRADGSTAHVRVAGGPLNPDEVGVSGALLSVVDLSEEHRLNEEYALLIKAVTQAHESIVITDADGTIRYINPAVTLGTGYSEAEVIGQTPSLFKSGEQDRSFYETLWSQISLGREWKGIFRNRRKDGRLFSEEASISPVHDENGTITGYIGVKRDVTRELEVQEYLLTSQKLQAVGTLAGGIAHDFNNILMAIMGYTEIARTDAETDSPLARQLDSIGIAAKRAQDLADQLLTFSRGGNRDNGPTDLVKAVSEAVALLRATTPTTIAIATDLEETSYSVRVGRTEIVQIVMNLGLNAVAAIDPSTGGHITVVVRAVQGQHPELVLSVTDDGVGMDEKTRGRIFEPFFSTRPVGKGTGMGLAVVHGIMTSADGTIRVTSTVGEGTRFILTLPAFLDHSRNEDEITEVQEDHSAIESSVRKCPEDSDLIMVVDDEPALVDMLSLALGHRGFRVTGFTNPVAAYDHFIEDPSRFSLILTDITMPEMRGDLFARQLRSVRPKIPIVAYTGYSAEVDETQATAAGIARLLHKPLDIDNLADVLRHVMN